MIGDALMHRITVVSSFQLKRCLLHTGSTSVAGLA